MNYSLIMHPLWKGQLSASCNFEDVSHPMRRCVCTGVDLTPGVIPAQPNQIFNSCMTGATQPGQDLLLTKRQLKLVS